MSEAEEKKTKYERCDYCWRNGGSSVLCPTYKSQENVSPPPPPLEEEEESK